MRFCNFCPIESKLWSEILIKKLLKKFNALMKTSVPLKIIYIYSFPGALIKIQILI